MATPFTWILLMHKLICYLVASFARNPVLLEAAEAEVAVRLRERGVHHHGVRPLSDDDLGHSSDSVFH